MLFGVAILQRGHAPEVRPGSVDLEGGIGAGSDRGGGGGGEEEEARDEGSSHYPAKASIGQSVGDMIKQKNQLNQRFPTESTVISGV